MSELFNTPLLQTMVEWLAIISLVTFFLSLIIITLVISKLSVTCFLNISPKPRENEYSLLRFVMLLLRNFLGALLLLAGILMLFLPGQGIITILISLLLLSFPGKYKLLNYLIHKPAVQRSLDWIRKKNHTEPFIWPDKT